MDDDLDDELEDERDFEFMVKSLLAPMLADYVRRAGGVMLGAFGDTFDPHAVGLPRSLPSDYVPGVIGCAVGQGLVEQKVITFDDQTHGLFVLVPVETAPPT